MFCSGGTITFWDGSSARFKGNGWNSGSGSANGSGWSFGDSPSINWYSGGGTNSGGGGNYNQPFNCRDGSFWGAVSPQSKKQALAEIENIFNLYNIDRCETLEQTDCMTSSDIICMAFEGNCMLITNGEFDVNHFNICMSEMLSTEEEFPPISTDCSIKAEDFILNNNISMTPEELVYLTNSYSYCSGTQSNFDNYVCEELPYHLLGQFSEKYGISISNSLAQDILSQVSTCNGNEFEVEVLDEFVATLNVPNHILIELNQFIWGSDDWVNVLDIEYPGENWQKAWNRLTAQEKALAKNHSLAALIIFSNKSKAENATNIKFPNTPQHNDKADAFRHAYFNALNVRHIQSEVVEAFGIAHENETHSDFVLEVEMDLFNNTIGRVIGNQNYQKSDEELSNIIELEVTVGGLKYLKPINYFSPYGNNSCYWKCNSDSNGDHGISANTQLINTNL